MSDDSARVRFGALVQEHIAHVVARAGFTPNASASVGAGVPDVLFEARPEQFMERYEDFMSDYGDQTPMCIDLWIKWRPSEARIEADLEGTDLETWLREAGHSVLADAFRSSDVEVAVGAVAKGLALLFDV